MEWLLPLSLFLSWTSMIRVRLIYLAGEIYFRLTWIRSLNSTQLSHSTTHRPCSNSAQASSSSNTRDVFASDQLRNLNLEYVIHFHSCFNDCLILVLLVFVNSTIIRIIMMIMMMMIIKINTMMMISADNDEKDDNSIIIVL